MALIKSISGIRGTIGGKPGGGLTPLDVVKFTSAYATFIRGKNPDLKEPVIVVGRDARISGQMVEQLVVATLVGMGMKVVLLGLSTTPTVEVEVVRQKADGGIIITASHNPKMWNALKLLNERGEFLNAEEGQQIVRLSQDDDYEFAEVDHLGTVVNVEDAMENHIRQVLALKRVDRQAIADARLKVVVDGINSTGSLVIPQLLKALGVDEVEVICKEVNGRFAHNPEPLPDHLKELSQRVRDSHADMGISVDPDVDRLAFVCENGEMFGEEYTLVAVADYILSEDKGCTVSNMSSSRALRDVSEKYGQAYYSAAVGEVNVVQKMKEVEAVIGGEGNGGVIYPELHYGRDALVGLALFLSHFAAQKKNGIRMTEWKTHFPAYTLSKNRMDLKEGVDVDRVFARLVDKYKDIHPSTIDGVKLIFEEDRSWVQLRKSNTEPIIRIYAEAPTAEKADALASRLIEELNALILD